ncbi:MAG: S-layer homology domain-containing protein [Chloroflexi bacterium]|nr:S-layer homology domain-containing protein [Chloroflexota bacterium]
MRLRVVVSAALLLTIATMWSFYQAPQAGAKESPKQRASGTSGTSGTTADSPTVACTINFGDVQSADYFYNAVRFLYCTGAIGGYPDGTFHPNSNATRGQLSKIVVNAEGWPLVNPATPSFSDVAVDSGFYEYVETAYQHRVISGYSDGTFRPNTNITRGQLAKIVVLAQGWPVLNPTVPSFSDVPGNSPFYGYVETAAAKGAVAGYADGAFRPGNLATRGQISKIVYFAATALTVVEQETVDLINSRRASMGLGVLRVDPGLSSAARRHSSDIGPLGLCQHNGTDGTSPWDRIDATGYSGFAMGEVIGCGYATAQDVVNGWWSSPAHYAILTDANANDIGCGWWMGENGYGWQTCNTGVSAR